ncbi:MAG TPA: hypothetical protein DDZ51_18725, partial [Planctomycetaceae bacterium]|nr:hypothetical protein [Planctomycetaceae bacterium]
QTSVFPAAGYLDLVSAAAKSLSQNNSPRLCVTDLRLLRPLAWSLGNPMRVQVVVDPVAPDEFIAKVLSRQASGWQQHATCRFTSAPVAEPTPTPTLKIQSAILANQSISPHEHYDRCNKVGLRYSGVFRCLTSLGVSQSGAHGAVSLPLESDNLGYEIHPALLDGCFQGIAGLMSDHDELWLPVSIGRYEVFSSSLDSAQPLRFTIVESASPTSTTRQFDLCVTNADQTPVAKISQLVVKRVANPDPVLQVAGTTLPDFAASHLNDLTAEYVSEPVQRCCSEDASHKSHAITAERDACDCDEDILLIRLRHRLSTIIECDEAELDVDTPLENLGFDSMMAIEMLDALEKDFGVKIPTDQFWSGLTLGGLLQRVREQASQAANTSDDAVQWVEGTL